MNIQISVTINRVTESTTTQVLLKKKSRSAYMKLALQRHPTSFTQSKKQEPLSTVPNLNHPKQEPNEQSIQILIKHHSDIISE
jgi:hypothetical protein